jgi:nucleotide-binding universal stress UspA family protein
MTNGALAYAARPIKTETFPHFERVLFTTDFSETSLRALSAAAAVARRFGSELRLVYAVTPGDQMCAVPEFSMGVMTIVEDDAKARLSALKNSTQLKELSVSTAVYKIGVGSLSREIAEDDVDLIVMATHGRKGLRHLLLGSLAEDVIHSAPRPVLTIGPNATLTTASEFRPKHVLFGTDASTDSFRALPYAVEFAKCQGAGLTLVHVLAHKKENNPEADAFAALMKDALHHTLPLTAIKSCSPEIVVRFGNPVKEILDVAAERESELIVMGARSNKNKATFNRSVSYGVISQATCPVLTVRGRES